jgi:hypothetical protein
MENTNELLDTLSQYSAWTTSYQYKKQSMLGKYPGSQKSIVLRAETNNSFLVST